METSPVTCRTLEDFYHIEAHTFEKQYKEVLSGYRTWSELPHADDWLVFSGNIGPNLAIDETSLSNGELYKEIKRIILTRPAVEAGENLGFLPGDLQDKLDPYLQPLYDALRDMIPPQKLLSYVEDKTIEIAPLAFMRGRTLDNAYVILDEAQNATATQLKMFLTRMGKNAKFLITGDLTQIDLPRYQTSGLLQATKMLENIKGIDVIFLDKSDVVRHPLVTAIIHAYEKVSDNKEEQKNVNNKSAEEK